MILFYTNNINDKIATLEGDEHIHCAKTLRKKMGDTIHFVDGNGGWYEGQLITITKKRTTIAIINREEVANRVTGLHIAIAPTKNINRLEWFLEKTTEIGISEITPILCQRSERKNIRLDRLQKIIVAAMKQSLKAHLPKINELTTFSNFIKKVTNEEQKFIAHCNDGDKMLLKNTVIPQKSALILIGPEGDFSNEEVDLALKADFQAISLGQERLRTETAGIVACHTVSLMNQ